MPPLLSLQELREEEEWAEVQQVLRAAEIDERQAARERADMEHRIKQRIELTRAFAEDHAAKVPPGWFFFFFVLCFSRAFVLPSMLVAREPCGAWGRASGPIFYVSSPAPAPASVPPAADRAPRPALFRLCPQAQRVAAEEQEEAAFKAAMLEKLAREDRIEQLNAQRRRLKAAEHKRAVETLIDERRARVALEREAMARGTAQEQAAEADRARIIEEERQRLLAEHAHRLLGFLPKSAIAGRADVDRLGADFQAFYRERERDEDDPW